MDNTTPVALASAPAAELFNVEGVPVIALPKGWTAQDYARLKAYPDRVRESQKFHHFQSFIEYVNRFKQPAASVIFVDGTKGDSLSARAHIDYHEPNGLPSWNTHVAEFNAAETPGWNQWREFNGKYMRQSEFADFLYRNQKDIGNPAGAELLETIRSLQATAKGEFREMRDQHTGSAELIYRVKVNAQGGTAERPLTLPTSFAVRVMPFYGCPELSLQADLRVQVPTRDNDPLTLGFRFYRLDDALQEFITQIIQRISTETGLPVWQ